jgi:glycosyltransferase involved in cell wall biosynthesis
MTALHRDGTPLVSILIVTFNQRSFVEDCVLSAAAQEYPNLEIVVSDDASTDGTGEIIEQLAAKHAVVTAITSDVRLGVTGNCNRALNACNGEYIAIVGGDDGLSPGKISTQVAWLEHDARRSLCYHDLHMIDDTTGTVMGLCSDALPMSEGVGPERIIRHGPPGLASSMMVRRDAIPVEGFDERLTIVSDWKLMMDCLADDRSFGFVPGVLGYYRVRADGLTQRSKREPAMANQWLDDTLKALAIVTAEHPQYAHVAGERRRTVYLEAFWTALVQRDAVRARAYAKGALLASRSPSPAPLVALCVAYGQPILGRPAVALEPILRSLYRRARGLRAAASRVWLP